MGCHNSKEKNLPDAKCISENKVSYYSDCKGNVMGLDTFYISNYYPDVLIDLLRDIDNSMWVFLMGYESHIFGDAQIGISGSIKRDESSHYAVKREMCEELGYYCPIISIMNKYQTRDTGFIYGYCVNAHELVKLKCGSNSYYCPTEDTKNKIIVLVSGTFNDCMKILKSKRSYPSYIDSTTESIKYHQIIKVQCAKDIGKFLIDNNYDRYSWDKKVKVIGDKIVPMI